MSKLKTFFGEFPRACGLTGDHALIEGNANIDRFKLETQDKNSVFRKLPEQTTMQRMKPAWGAWEDFADQEILAYGKRLSCYAADCYALNKVGVEHPQELKDEGTYLASLEPAYPTISALYTVADATTQSNWV